MQIFLVDDSSSMMEHWDDVTACVDILSYTVKKFDRDGIDLYFTISDDKCNEKHATPIVDAVKKHRLLPSSRSSHRMADIYSRLVQILNGYRADLDKKYGPHRLHLPTHRVKKTILFIFTDGLWQPESDAEGPIRDLLKTLKDYSLPNNQFGIQFVRFGDEAEGIELLDYLDDLPDLAPYP